MAPQLREYMRHKELPVAIQNRLTTYYGYCTRRSIDLEKRIMSQVSVQLREVNRLLLGPVANSE